MTMGLGLGLWPNQAAVSGGGFTNLVTNGDFSAGSTGWTLEATTTVSGGHAVATAAGNMLYQNVPLSAGPTYTISFTYTCTSGINLRIETPNGPVTGGPIVLDQAIVADGATHTYSGTFTAINSWLSISASGAQFTGTIDNIVVHT